MTVKTSQAWALLRNNLHRHKWVLVTVAATGFIFNALNLAIPLISQAIVDLVIAGKELSKLVALSAVLLSFTFLSGVFSWVYRTAQTRLYARVDLATSQGFLRGLFSVPLQELQTRQAGSYYSRLPGLERMRDFVVNAFLGVCIDLPVVLTIIGLLLYLSPELAAMALTLVAVIVSASVWAGPGLKRRYDRVMDSANALQGTFNEKVSAAETVKSLQMEGVAIERISVKRERNLESTRNFQQASNNLLVFNATAEQVLAAAILTVGAYWTLTAQNFSIGSLLAFQLLTQQLSKPLFYLVDLWPRWQQAKASAAQVDEIIELAREDVLPSSVVPVSRNPVSVDFDSVSYAYPGADFSQLSQVSLHIPAGALCLVTGPSGAGKSTLAKMLQGHIAPTVGTVRIQGDDIARLPLAQVRSLVAVVPQESILFSGSILENMQMVAPQVSLEGVQVLCRQVGVHDEIMAMSKGYDTVLGERGIGLSGGQRQRLALVRALLKGPKILILDEPLSGADVESAQKIVSALDSLRGFVTTLLISHQVPKELQPDVVFKLERQ